jgi:O-antigen/teichoic acid export membrane protein
MTITAPTRSGPMAALRDIWQRNHDLLRNAGSLVATTGLTSVFGFGYWVVAARDFTKPEVGYGAATVSAMTLVGTIGMFGLGTMLIGELPRRRDRGGLITATVLTSLIGSLVLGLGYPVVFWAFGGHAPSISGTPERVALFAVGAALTGATFVLDEGTIGLMRGGVQLWRNLVASGVKLAALPVAALVLHDGFGVGLVLAWVIGTVLSLIPTAIMLMRGGSRVFHRPDWGLLRRLGKVALAHNWLNLAIATPPKLVPVIVLAVVNPAATAVFYDAWMMAGFLFMVPASLSTVLFAIASAAPELIAEKLRFVLRLSVLIGLPAMAVLAIGAHFALNIFGPGYAQLGTVPLLLLILTYIPGLPQQQYIAVCRATGKVAKAAMVMAVSAACEMAAVAIGGKLGGLNGLCAAYLGVTIVVGFVTAPTVFRAAYGRIQQRKAATGAMPVLRDTVGATGPLSVGYLDRQETGLAKLLALASAAVAEGHTLDAAVEVWRTGSFPAITGSFTAVTRSFQAVGPDSGRPKRAANMHRRHTGAPATRADLFGRGAAGAGPATQADLFHGGAAGTGPEPAGYRSAQQAGLDALISLATPVPPDAYSPNGQSPNGQSRNGQSPNGRSPNGQSPNGQSSNGHSSNGQSRNGHSPNGHSPNGQSANGKSPNGKSPNGKSPNGKSPNGKSPNAHGKGAASRK